MKKIPFIIFLDIDGVFNCQLFYKERRARWLKDGSPDKNGTMAEYHQSQFCRERVTWFNDLVKDIDATVVVSSTWRGDGVEKLQEIFDSVGGTFKVHDVTPYGGKGTVRGCEIKMWICDNITKEEYGINYYDFYKYAIIDDDSDMLLNQANHFFQTDNYSGLTPNTCYKIKRFATHETF
jgi:hypothetical protein